MYEVRWRYTGTPGLWAVIWLERQPQNGINYIPVKIADNIFTGMWGKGFYCWTVPANQAPGTYKIRVQSMSLPYVKDTSNNSFTISNHIGVISPNGGETWIMGSTHPITWSSTGYVGSLVKIELLKAGIVVQPLSLRYLQTMGLLTGKFPPILFPGAITGFGSRVRPIRCIRI